MCDDTSRDEVTATVVPRDDTGAALGAANSASVAMDGLAGGAVQDKGDGSYVVTFTAATCGPAARQATVRVNGVDIVQADATVSFPCSPVDPNASGLSVAKPKGVADGHTGIDVTVAATNTCGEPAKHRSVLLAADLGTLSATSGDTDDAGSFTSALASTKSGPASITATVDGVAIGSAQVTFDEPKSGGGGCGTTGTGSGAAVLALAAAALLARRRRT
jgi:uncharacterized protein (TIGR03382 family)